ncbi:MAG: sodium/solute symporter [Actinobacteria bacterium]|nr:sodium/solute symporter [Actinomycetota bacterium]
MHPTAGTPLDLWIIIAYFVGVMAFGSFFGKFIRGTKEFFFAGQKLSWWLIAMSSIATTVGSYSFVKYSQAAFKYGFSSTQTYLNDWFWMPFWMFGWLPIIYFSRIASVPEYFEKRFDRRTRTAATVIMLLYLIGYVGINLYTMGVALHRLLGWNIFTAAALTAVICAVYVTFGGQTSVIMTDLLQGFLLLIAGFALFFIGLHYVGGFDAFWHHLPISFKSALPAFNKPPEFNFVGVFWQDGMANSAAFYFMNQGILLRYLSAKSVREGRKAVTAVVLVLMPLAAFAVANVGWIGRSMVSLGLLDASIDSRDVFVVVSEVLCKPGVFGLILAALIAALMSTADTLINAVSVISVNDIYRPYIKKNASDKHYLLVARIVSVVTAGIGILLVPVYMGFKTIYAAHGAFTAMMTPPIVVAILFGAFWKRYTPKAAFWTLLGGMVIIFTSIKFPDMIRPFSQGVPGDDGYTYMRAFFGLIVSGAIGIIVTMFTEPRSDESVKGLVFDSIQDAMMKFKGGKPNLKPGKKVPVALKLVAPDAQQIDQVRVSVEDMRRMRANEGDFANLSDARWWTGGLASANVVLGAPHEEAGVVYVNEDLLKQENVPAKRPLVIEKII